MSLVRNLKRKSRLFGTLTEINFALGYFRPKEIRDQTNLFDGLKNIMEVNQSSKPIKIQKLFTRLRHDVD